jgi:hypothetical protein
MAIAGGDLIVTYGSQPTLHRAVTPKMTRHTLQC